MYNLVKAAAYIDQLADIVTGFSALPQEYAKNIFQIQQQFITINTNVKEALYFLKNPNEKIIEELNQKFNLAEKESKQLEKELFEKLSEKCSGDLEKISRNNLDYFYHRFHRISIINESSSNIIAGLHALDQSPPCLPCAGQIYEWYRHCHRLWNLAQATHGKIEMAKKLKLSEKQNLLDTEKQFRQIIEEMNESFQALYYEHTNEIYLKDQISPYIELMAYWLQILSEIICLLSSDLREKEWLKIDIIFRRGSLPNRYDILIGSCIDVSKNMELCRLLRTHAVQMKQYNIEYEKNHVFLLQELIPVRLRSKLNNNNEEDFYFDSKLEELMATMSNIEYAIDRYKMNLCMFEHISDVDDDKKIVIQFHKQTKCIKTLRRLLGFLNAINQADLICHRYSNELHSEFQAEKNLLFKSFEAQPLKNLTQFQSEIEKIKLPSFQKILYMNRTKYINLKYIPDKELMWHVSNGLSIHGVENLCQTLLPNIKSLRYRELNISEEIVKEITAVVIEDGGLLPIESLYLRADQNIDFFFFKLEVQIKQSARRIYQKAIEKLVNNPDQVYEVSFWKSMNMPTSILVVTLEVFSTISPLSAAKLKELKKNLGTEESKNLQKLACELEWMLKQPKSDKWQPMYKSSHFKNMDPSEQSIKLVQNCIDEFVRADVVIDDVTYTWWPSTIGGSFYAKGLLRKHILNHKSKAHQKFGLSSVIDVKILAALLGRKLLIVSDNNNSPPIVLDDSFVYFQQKVNAKEQEYLVQLFLKEMSIGTEAECGLGKSKSAMELANPIATISPPTRSYSTMDCRVEKIHYPQYFSYPQKLTNSYLNAFTYSIDVLAEDNTSSEEFKHILSNFNLNGHSNLADKAIAILKDFCGDLKHVDLDQIITLASTINDVIECQTTSSSPSISASDNDGSTSTKSNKTGSSNSSKSAERSQTYSTQIRKTKNVEISMALSLYIYICNFDKFFASEVERHLAHMLCSSFSAIRMALFDRLWQNYAVQISASVQNKFLCCETFSVIDVKHLNSFIHSIILASFYRQEIRIHDSVLAEVLIYMINDAIRGTGSLLTGADDDSIISSRGSVTNVSTSTNSFNAKISRVGNHLLPENVVVLYSDDIEQELEMLTQRKLGNGSDEKFWIITRSEYGSISTIPQWVRIFYLDKTNGIRIPDFLWKSIYRFNMLHMDSQIDILKECGDHIVTKSIEILTRCFVRFVDVYRNTAVETDDDRALYNKRNISHWYGVHSANRLIIVQKHLLQWAHKQGLLPSDRATVKFPDCQVTLAKLNRLIRFSIYWSFALGLHPRAREAFSFEFQKNISDVDEDCDLSHVYISTNGEFENFMDLIEYQTIEIGHGYIPSLQLLQGKWLLGVFAPTDQSVIHSNFQLFGPNESGKSHLLSYYDIDHPKPQKSKIIPGGSNQFWSRFKKFSPCQLVPDNLTHANSTRFIRSISKPIISVQQGVESFQSGYPLLQYHVDFECDIDTIYQLLIQKKISLLINRCKSDEHVVDQMTINSLSEKIFIYLKDLIVFTKTVKMGRLSWFKLLTTTLFDLFNYYFEQERENKACWTEIFKFIVLESILQIARILYDSGSNEDRISISLVKSLVPALGNVERAFEDFNNVSATRRITVHLSAQQIQQRLTEIAKKKDKLSATLFVGHDDRRVLSGVEHIPNSLNVVITPHLVHYIEQCLFCFRITNRVLIKSSVSFIGRRTGARIVSKLLNLHYFEIAGGDGFRDQMLVALRLDQPLLFFIKEESVPKEHWNGLIRLADTRDIFSILSSSEICSVIDPQNYHADKYKIRCTALEHLQQKWAYQMRFIIVPSVSNPIEIISSVTICLSTWKHSDWTTFTTHCFSTIGLESEIVTKLAAVIAEFVIENNLNFSPTFVQKCIAEYGYLYNIKQEEINANFGRISLVCDAIDTAHTGYDKMISDCEETKAKLEAAIETLEELKKETDVSMESYRTQFDETLETERKFQKLERFVNELRVQTDTNSQFHPLFERAQSVLRTLNAHDFEEIRSYRKPPGSVVLVVEAICILFNVQPTWECGQMLMHKENFFQDLEFFDKESVSQSAFQKLQHRLNRVDEREVKKASSAALGLLHWLEAIAGFSTTYSKMLPIIHQLEAAEVDLCQIQRELGKARVSLDELKNKFDLVDAKRLEQTEIVIQLRSTIRHQNTELESLQAFLDNLNFCSGKWREDYANLKYTKNVCNVEILISIIFMFFIARFPTDGAEVMLKKIHQYAMTVFKELIEIDQKDIRQYYANHLGIQLSNEKGPPHAIFEQYAKYRQIEYDLMQWTGGPCIFPSKLLINKVQDLETIRNTWYDLICTIQFPDFIKQENLYKWNEQIILKEITDLEGRLFTDIINQKVPLIELRYLRKIVEKRKKAKADWQTTFSHNVSLGKDQITRYLTYRIFAIFSVPVLYCSD